MNSEYSQLSLLDEIECQEEQRARIRERALRTKLEDEYVQIREIYSEWENIPDHSGEQDPAPVFQMRRRPSSNVIRAQCAHHQRTEYGMAGCSVLVFRRQARL